MAQAASDGRPDVAASPRQGALSKQIYSLHQICGARRRAKAMPTRPSLLSKERYLRSAFLGGCAQFKKILPLAILLFANRYGPFFFSVYFTWQFVNVGNTAAINFATDLFLLLHADADTVTCKGNP